MNDSKHRGVLVSAAATALAMTWPLGPAAAHHSFAMYTEEYIFSAVGEVVEFRPGASHAAIDFFILNAERTGLVMSEAGSPVIWRVELGAAAAEVRRGVSETNFPPGTVFSIYLYPARASVNVSPIVSGLGSARTGIANAYLVACPTDIDGKPILPPAGKFCDAVEDSRAFGSGAMPADAIEWAIAIRSEGDNIRPVAEEGSPLRPCEDRAFVILRPDSAAASAAAQDNDCPVAPNIGGGARSPDSPVIRRRPGER